MHEQSLCTEMIVEDIPSLPALLPNAARDPGRDLGPLRDACVDAGHDCVVLLLCPRALHQTRSQHLGQIETE